MIQLPRLNVQRCAGYRVCSGMRAVVLCKLHDVEIVQDAAGVVNMGVEDNGVVGRKKGYIYCSSCASIYIQCFVG
jgi:hypothetical protein